MLTNVLILANPFACQGVIEDPFQDLPTYTLNLRISLPPTSGFLIYFWKSQSVVISTFTGEPEDKTAPDWLQLVAPERKFWQRRSLMVDMMLYFSELPQNARVSDRVKDWCRALSVCYLMYSKVAPLTKLQLPLSGLSTSVYSRPHFDPIKPCNTRRHKPQVFNWFAEETQRWLKDINQGSPVRRNK